MLQGLGHQALAKAYLAWCLPGCALLLRTRRLPPHYGRQIEIIVGLSSESVTHHHHPVLEGAASL
jgi:hypothetical protein